MPLYRYRGVTAGNNSVSSTIDADSPRSARLRLRAEGIYPTEIVEGKMNWETDLPKPKRKSRRRVRKA